MADLVTGLKIFRRKGIRNMNLVAGGAVRDVMEGAQTPQTSAKFTGGSFVVGKIPVLWGPLRDSLQSSKNGGGVVKGATSYLAVTAALQIGDVVMFEWAQPYALRIEKGFRGTDRMGRSYNQAGRFFLATNAAKFRQFVEQRAAQVNK